MKKGMYLKEAEEKNTRSPRRSRRGPRARHNRSKMLIVIGVAGVLALLLAVILLQEGAQPIYGRWSLDGVTVYEFEADGLGALVLPHTEYAFEYEIKGNTLKIFFADEDAKDAEYTFSIEEDTLTLVGGNATNQGTYVLTRGA